LQVWKFIPNQVYEVPKGLIDEVNAHKTMIRGEQIDKDGNVIQARDEEESPLHQFVPVGF